MYYRVAILGGSSPPWQWKSTALSSLQSLFQVLRLYGALPQEHLRVFSCPSREGLEEQLRQENSGRGSASVTAAHFLQQRMIHSNGVMSAGGSQGHERTTSVAVVTESSLGENRRGGNALDGRSMSPLEQRREELERGGGGDHDLPYRYTGPSSMPQVLAWMKLLVRVQDGTLLP